MNMEIILLYNKSAQIYRYLLLIGCCLCVYWICRSSAFLREEENGDT